MVEIIDVEIYKSKEQCIVHDNIYHVLYSNDIFRLDAFSYSPEDCLFDGFHILFHLLFLCLTII
jgi:hypothetical protein